MFAGAGHDFSGYFIVNSHFFRSFISFKTTTQSWISLVEARCYTEVEISRASRDCSTLVPWDIQVGLGGGMLQALKDGDYTTDFFGERLKERANQNQVEILFRFYFVAFGKISYA